MRIKLSEGIVEIINQPSSKDCIPRLASHILDGKIPITKIIGFSVADSKGLSKATVLERTLNCLQPMTVLARNLSYLSFSEATQDKGVLHLSAGTFDSSSFLPACGGQFLQPIVSGIPVLSSIGEIVMHFVFRCSTGFASIDDNVNYMVNKGGIYIHQYFPIQSSHTFADYFWLATPSRYMLRYDVDVNVALIEQLINKHIERW